MRLETRERERAVPALGALIGGVLLVAAAAVAGWVRLGLPLPGCPLREWTGVPCPTCGAGRMAESLLSGDVVEAVTWNPLVFSGLIVVALWAVASAARMIFRLPAWRLVTGPRERIGLWILASAVVVAGWAYLVWRGV